MKPCSRCRRTLPASSFYNRENGWLFSRCKECVSEVERSRYPLIKDKKRKSHRAYYINNRAKTLARCKKNYEKNRERLLLFYKERRKRPEYRSQVLAFLKKWKKQRAITDPQYALREKLRKTIWTRLHIRGAKKRHSTLTLLGCSIADFKRHIESLWVSGMTWENYGKQWQIDHIRPLASFDLRNENEQLQAFHFSNTQPLWSADNLKKGATWVVARTQ